MSDLFDSTPSSDSGGADTRWWKETTGRRIAGAVICLAVFATLSVLRLRGAGGVDASPALLLALTALSTVGLVKLLVAR